MHNEELNDLYSSPNIVRVIKSRRMRGAGHVGWVDNIRVDLQQVGCGYMDWIGLPQDRERWWTLVTAVMNLRVP